MKFRIISVRASDEEFKLQYRKGFFSTWKTLKFKDKPIWNNKKQEYRYNDWIFYSVKDIEDFLSGIDFRAYFYNENKKDKVVKEFSITRRNNVS